jgi:glycosyltransferase involved in cell wall biosynthesis
VVSSDTLPYPGYPTTGAGLRAWGLGEGLRARGHDVVYAMPRRCLGAKGAQSPLPPNPPFLFDNRLALPRVVNRARPDVLLFQHWSLVPYAAHLDIPIAIDFHGPNLLEIAFQRRSREYLAVLSQRKLGALRRGDFFTCAGELQKKYFLSWLLMAGADLTGEVIHVVPISLGPDLPEHTWPEPEVNFVYGGVFLPWQDPSVGLKALLAEMDRAGRGRLDFFGGKHGFLKIPTGVYAELEPLLAASPRVTLHGMVARDALVHHYQRSYAALDVMARNYERELAFTTRTAEYLWCGLAVVYADYAEMASLIREYEAGWIVSPEDAEGVALTLRQILSDPAEARRRGRNAQRLASERLDWTRTIAPLDAFCRDPRRRHQEGAAAQLRSRLRYLVLRTAFGTRAGDLFLKLPEAVRARVRPLFRADKKL